MATAWNVIYDRFFIKIEKDADFFAYFNLTPEESVALAQERAKHYLIEAIAKLTTYGKYDIDFDDYNESTETFNIDLNNREIDLLANFMYEKYFEKDLSLLKAFKVHFTPKDLTVFSPANERKTFSDMFNSVVEKNEILIREYIARDRNTGKLKLINFASFQE